MRKGRSRKTGKESEKSLSVKCKRVQVIGFRVMSVLRAEGVTEIEATRCLLEQGLLKRHIMRVSREEERDSYDKYGM